MGRLNACTTLCPQGTESKPAYTFMSQTNRPSGSQRTLEIASVGVYGASGYTGQTLLQILKKHPSVRVAFATAESSAEPVEGFAVVQAEHAPLDSVSVVFLCLPNGVSGAVAAKALAAGIRVIDLSADLRLDSADLYTQVYKMAHPAPSLLPAPYGLPEITRANLAGQPYIANPGCHVTAVLLALFPLALHNALAATPIIADTKTGISGAGRQAKIENLFAEAYGDVRPYNVGRKHRHVPEIEQLLRKIQPDAGPLVFSPHVVPVDVGLLATVYAPLRPGWTRAHVLEAFRSQYQDEPLVHLLPDGEVARFKHTAHKNHAAVAVSEMVGEMAIITCSIDNLRKGAAAQAVQNFNLMLGFPETLGLL
jgi:N-acetyl-gamma-glutamyl-phosphate reductase